MLPGDPEKRGSPPMEKADHRPSTSSASGTAVEHHDHVSTHTSPTHAATGHDGKPVTDGLEASKKLANPLSGLSRQKLGAMGEAYARLAGLTSEEDLRAFRLGAMISGDNTEYDAILDLTDREREILLRETTHKWSQPRMLYWVIISKSKRLHVQLCLASS